MPLDPKIARLLLAGRQYHCLTEILVIASALSVQDPRERPLDRQEAADAAHKRFADERSDFLAYLKIWAWFEQALAEKKSNRLLAEECRRNFLSPLRLREWRELHQQLHAQVAEMGMFKNAPTLIPPPGEREPPALNLQLAPSPTGGGLGRGSLVERKVLRVIPPYPKYFCLMRANCEKMQQMPKIYFGSCCVEIKFSDSVFAASIRQVHIFWIFIVIRQSWRSSWMEDNMPRKCNARTMTSAETG